MMRNKKNIVFYTLYKIKIGE